MIFPSIIQKMFNYQTIAFISYASKTILKILQARLQQLQIFKLDLEKVEEPETKSSKRDHTKSKRIPEKNLLLLH